MPAAIITKTKKLLFSEQDNILKASFAMMFIILITKISGFLYSAIVAQQLGASRESDLFLLANTIPEILGNLILVGLISAALMPIMIKARTNGGHERFVKFFNTLLNFSLLVFVFVALIFVIWAHEFFPFILNTLIRSNFVFTPEELDRAAYMMQILMIPQLILGISAFYSSSLNVMYRFIAPQLAPLFYNLGRTLGAIIFVPWLGGAEGLTWGTILGALLHLGIQIPWIINIKIKHSAQIDFKDKYFREALSVGWPRLIGIGGEYIANGVDRFIAARFVQGSVTAFDFALRLVSIPLTLFGMTFSVAAFPTLSKLYQEDNKIKFKKLFVKLVNQVAFLSIPVTVILLVLRVSLVRLFYGIFKGNFSFEDTYLTAWGVMFLAIGLVFESLRSLFYRAFYATGDTIRPLFAGLFTMVVGLLTGIMFSNYFSHFEIFDFKHIYWSTEYFFHTSDGKAAVGGLALSSSFTFTLEFILLLWMTRSQNWGLNIVDLIYRLLKKILAGTIMAISMFVIFKIWGSTQFQEKTVYLLVFVSVTSIIGSSIYLLVSYLLRIQEVNVFTKFVSKFNPKKWFVALKKQKVSLNVAE